MRLLYLCSKPCSRSSPKIVAGKQHSCTSSVNTMCICTQPFRHDFSKSYPSRPHLNLQARFFNLQSPGQNLQARICNLQAYVCVVRSRFGSRSHGATTVHICNARWRSPKGPGEGRETFHRELMEEAWTLTAAHREDLAGARENPQDPPALIDDKPSVMDLLQRTNG